MALGGDRQKEDFELLPALARLELKRRKLTQELGEVLIEYQQLELETERRRIVIPWLTPGAQAPDLPLTTTVKRSPFGHRFDYRSPVSYR